jgi:broad specificity phosphatase PhoE
VSLIHLIRHGEAAAGWGEERDPGLSPAGRAQAEAVAATLAPLGPLPVLVSPLRRTRETAEPIERALGVEAVLAAQFAEVPSPSDDLAERAAWLGRLFATAWAEWPADLIAWRQGIAADLAALTADTVVVTHFVPIVAAIAAATGEHDPSLHPGYCSHTVLRAEGGRLSLVSTGEQRTTVIR